MTKSEKLSFKEVAFRILKSVSEPLSAKEIVELAIQEGILSTEGQTPEATMAAQLYVDINNNKKSKFKKVGKGKFTLIEQTESSTSPLLLIEKQNNLVKSALMQTLNEMDPFQFEFLIADLLKAIGYEDVEVTKRSGDKGIDVIANLTMDGITDVKTIIQAKRFKQGNNISGKIITQLRGSAEVDQRGLVITTSDFTKDAINEAKSPYKMPVSLVNGEKLLSLLIRYGVGVKKDTVELYSLDNEYFENEEAPEGKKSSFGKNRGLWPLPGGATSYVETLFSFMEAVTKGINTQGKLTKWYKQSFENVKSDKTAHGYIRVPRVMGLTSVHNGTIQLTPDGEQVLKTKNLNFLYDVISKNIFAFNDIVEFIKTSGEPQSEQSILEYLNENFDIDWQTFAQVNFRLLWLINLEKIKEVKDGYVLA
jgi:restriction endonuclease Mrr